MYGAGLHMRALAHRACVGIGEHRQDGRPHRGRECWLPTICGARGCLASREGGPVQKVVPFGMDRRQRQADF